MDLPGVVQRRRRWITQPVEEEETLAGARFQLAPPLANARVSETVIEETDICIRKIVDGSPLNVDNEASPSGMHESISRALSMEEEEVVDMQQTRELRSCLEIREAGTLEKDLSVSLRSNRASCSVTDELTDLNIIESLEEPDVKRQGPISKGNDADIVQLLNETTYRGVIIEDQEVLHCDNGMYMEGHQYRIIPGTQSKGAFGEAAMCEDLTTRKSFMRKTVQSKLSKNEVKVPVMFRGNVGIPEVYGVNITDQGTEIYQEFAGLSLKMMLELRPDYARQLCDPKMVMVLGFQAFATLQKLHSQGVTHQDIKPENLCLDIQPKGVWRLKFIDFGSSQTPEDQVIEGLTNEYLSPESCNTILQVATEKLSKEDGRLGPGTDVWALALSLLYCLCGYHVMVYLLTGHPRYLEQDPTKLQYLRMQCLIKIRNLKDEDIMMKLIRPEWPDALKTLLLNTLRVDPTERWSAKDAAEFILRNWILKGSGAGSQQQATPTPVVQAATPPVAARIMFRGLAAPRLVYQPQPVIQASVPQAVQGICETQAVQCTSPTGAGASAYASSACPSSSSADAPTPSQLPDFNDLLSNSTTKKPVRRCRGKQRLEPYTQSGRRASKN